MLNKKICAKCRSIHLAEKLAFGSTDLAVETYILKHCITWICHKTRMPVGKGQPPPKCEYMLEHAITETMNNGDV